MYKYLLITCLFIVNFSFGQDVLVSDEISIRGATQYEIVGKVNEKIFVVVGNHDSYDIHAFDERRLHESWEQPLKFEKRSMKVLGTLSGGNHFLIFYQYRKGGVTFLKVRKYDDQMRLLDSTSIKEFRNRAFSPDFEFILSDDKSKVLFYDGERDRKIEAIVFDIKTMKTLWSNIFKPNNFNYYEDFLEAIVDNNGSLHIVTEKDNKRYKKDQSRFLVYYFEATTKIFHNYSVSMQGQIWYDVAFKFDNLNNRLVVGGLYAEKKNTDVTGYFYMRIDPKDPAAYELSFTPLDRGRLTKLYGKEIKENKGFSDVIVQEVILRRDGGALVVVERFKEYVRQTGNATSSPYTGRDRFQAAQVDYYYDNILLLSVHPDGKLHWQEILHKKQFSQDDGGIFSSYFLVKTPKSLRFLYNDEVKYENPIGEYVVYGSGESKRNGLFSTHGKKLKLRLRDSLQISSTQLLIPSERRNRLNLILVSYKE